MNTVEQRDQLRHFTLIVYQVYHACFCFVYVYAYVVVVVVVVVACVRACECVSVAYLKCNVIFTTILLLTG